VACSAVTATTVATWATDPVPATLYAGVTSNVAMAFGPAGSATIGVNFEDAGAWPITIAESSVTFPAASCGATLATRTVSITNVSSASVTVTGAISDSAPIALSPTTLTLAAGKTGTMALVAAAPTSPGSFNGTLTLTTSVVGDAPHVLPVYEQVSGTTFAFEAITGTAEPTLSWGSPEDGTGTATTYLDGASDASPSTVSVVVTAGSENLPGAELLINGAAASSWKGTGGLNTIIYSLSAPANTPCAAIFEYTVTVPSNLPGVCGGATQTLTILEGNGC
jgi:hypothetical protein